MAIEYRALSMGPRTTHEPSRIPVQPFVAYATKGCTARFMASIHVRILEVSPFHEPQKVLGQICIAYATWNCPIRFMVSMRGKMAVEATHEPLVRSSGFSRSGPLSHRPQAPSLPKCCSYSKSTASQATSAHREACRTWGLL